MFPCLYASIQRTGGKQLFWWSGIHSPFPKWDLHRTGSEVIHILVQALCQTPQNCRASERYRSQSKTREGNVILSHNAVFLLHNYTHFLPQGFFFFLDFNISVYAFSICKLDFAYLLFCRLHPQIYFTGVFVYYIFTVSWPRLSILNYDNP